MVEMLTAEKNRLGRTFNKRVKKDIQRHVSWLEKRVKESNKDLQEFIKNTPIWQGKDVIIRSVPGAGPVLSSTLLCELPELGTLSHKQIAALAAIRPNPVIREFHQRLIKAGKKHKVAITACMRKLLVVLNAMLRDRSTWIDYCPQIA